MKKIQLKHITGAWRYYFITICCAALIYTWTYRGFQVNGDENAVVGYFILCGVIATLAVFSLRRSIYRQIGEIDQKALKKILASKGKQRPLEMSRGKNMTFSGQIEDLFSTYNTFRLFSVVLISVVLWGDVLLLA